MRLAPFILCLLLVSCASLDELIQEKRYDLALERGYKILKKTPNDHATKKQMEKAYLLAQTEDLDRIKRIREAEKSRVNLDKIFRYYLILETRKLKMDAAGLKAKGDPYNPMELNLARDEVCWATTDYAEELMFKEERKAYKSAYGQWRRVKDYRCEYENVDSLINLTFDLGRAVVALQLENQQGVPIPEHTEKALRNKKFIKRDDLGQWILFYNGIPNDREIDYTIKVNYNQVSVSRNKTTKGSQSAQKKVISGYDYVKDKDGKTVKVPKYKTVKATIKSTRQQKQATQGAYVTIIDNSNGNIISQQQLEVAYNYDYTYYTLSGDIAALNDSQKKLLKLKYRTFPSTSVMVRKSGDKLVRRIRSEIYKWRKSYI